VRRLLAVSYGGVQLVELRRAARLVGDQNFAAAAALVHEQALGRFTDIALRARCNGQSEQAEAVRATARVAERLFALRLVAIFLGLPRTLRSG